MKLGISDEQGVFPRTGKPNVKGLHDYLRSSGTLKPLKTPATESNKFIFGLKESMFMNSAKPTLNKNQCS